jgi:hypothetical protein
MLDNKRQNFHHSKLPSLGDIVILPGLHNVGYTGKWIVESFNLCDNILPYSIGIHTANLVSLRDRNIRTTVSGFHCEVVL